MYAMSWERNNNEYKYESIQHGYEVEDFYDENESDEISLDVMIDDGFDLADEEIEMEIK